LSALSKNFSEAVGTFADKIFVVHDKNPPSKEHRNFFRKNITVKIFCQRRGKLKLRIKNYRREFGSLRQKIFWSVDRSPIKFNDAAN